VRADQVVELKPGDGEHRRAVELRVVKPVQEMNPARPGGRQANTELAGILRVCARHERCRLFVPHLDEANAIASLAQRFHNAVDAVPRKPEDDVHSPVRN